MKSNPWKTWYGILLISVMIGSFLVGITVGSNSESKLEPSPAPGTPAASNSIDSLPAEAPAVSDEPTASTASTPESDAQQAGSEVNAGQNTDQSAAANEAAAPVQQ